EDRRVVAIAGPQFQHPPRGVKKLDAENVPRVPNVPLYPVVQSANFPKSILWANAGVAKNLDCFLANVKILRAALNHFSDHSRRHQRASIAARHFHESYFRNDEAIA